VTRTSSRVKALARVARPIGQHGTVVAGSRRWPPPRRVHAGRTLSPRAPGPAPKLWIHRYPVRGRCRPCPTSPNRPCTGPVTTAHRKPDYASQQWRRVLAPEAHRTPGRRAVIRAPTDRSAARFAPIDSRPGCIFQSVAQRARRPIRPQYLEHLSKMALDLVAPELWPRFVRQADLCTIRLG